MDQMSTQIRHFRPVAVNKTEVTTYCIAPVGESDEARERRIRQYEDFFNATGMATPDDLTAFNNSQLGFMGEKAKWSDMSRGAKNVVEGASDFGDVLIVDGANKPFRFRMEGTGVLTSRTFITEEITVSGTVAPKVGTIHDKHFVVAGDASQKNVIFFSGVNEVNNFSAATAGNISLEDAVVGIKSFRNELFIFCRES